MANIKPGPLGWDHTWRRAGWNIDKWIAAVDEGEADPWIPDALMAARDGRAKCDSCGRQFGSERELDLISGSLLTEWNFYDIAVYCTTCVAVHGADALDNTRAWRMAGVPPGAQ
jgi:hypothetical protein